MGVKAKALTRKITRKQAMSYERSYPNARGVTNLNEINGPGAYSRRYADTRDLLSSEKRMYTANERAAMKRMSPKKRATFRKLLKAKGPNLGKRKFRPNKAPRTAAEIRNYREGHARAFGAQLGPEGSGWLDEYYTGEKPVRGRKKRRKKKASKRRTRKSAAARTTTRKSTGWTTAKRKAAAKKAAATRKRNKLKRSKAAKKAAATRRASSKRTSTRRAASKRRSRKLTRAQRSAAAKKGWRTRRRQGTASSRRGKTTAKRRKQRRVYGRKYKALQARIGPSRRWTYKYRTKSGRVADIPDFALLGYPSRAALKRANEHGSRKERARLWKRMQKLALRRERDAERTARRISQGLGIFSPNAGDEILSFEEWKDMRPNRGRPKRRARLKKASKKRATRRRKTSKRKSTGWTTAKRKAAAKKAAATRKRNKLKRSKAAKKAAATRRRRSGKKTAKRRTKRSGKRRVSAKTKSKISRALKRYHKTCKPTAKRKSSKRRGKRRSVRGRKRNALGRFTRNQGSYAVNRRRGYRRNLGKSAYVKELSGALKLGALVTAGFMGHRALTKVVDKHLMSKIEALSTGKMAPYRGIISGAATALVGILGTLAAVPDAKVIGMRGAAKYATPALAGMAASFIHGAVVTLLGQHDATAEAAAYMSGYPNAEGSAMGSYYEYQARQQYPGVGSYYELPPMSGYGQYQQAAAGMGQMTQAAAGMGQVTQAAAGTGEYVAVGVDGIGEYEELPTRSMGMTVDEGVYPNMQSAEQALTYSEAAAGVGSSEVPLQSTINPTMVSDPVGDEPGGSRAGVFQGNVFG